MTDETIFDSLDRDWGRCSRPSGSDRGRLTPVDVIFIAVGLAALAFLSEPFYTALSQSSGSLSEGTEILFRMLPPALVTMLIFVTYRTALIGGS